MSAREDDSRDARRVGRASDRSEVLGILDPIERDEGRAGRLRPGEERLELQLGKRSRLEPHPRALLGEIRRGRFALDDPDSGVARERLEIRPLGPRRT